MFVSKQAAAVAKHILLSQVTQWGFSSNRAKRGSRREPKKIVKFHRVGEYRVVVFRLARSTFLLPW